MEGLWIFNWLIVQGCCLLFVTSFLLSPAAIGLADQTAPAPTEETNVEIQHDAMEALTAMGHYLNTLKSFTVSSTVSMDEVLLTGQKILVTGTTEMTARLPDRLRGSAKIEELNRDLEYFYDGKSFTIFGHNNNYYALFNAPPTITELLDIAQERYNVEIPLRDLFWWGTEKARVDDIQSAFFIDTNRVDGTTCKHYAFRQEDVDWQVWIEDGKTPLPRRLVITSKLENGQPQYISTMTWNTVPELSDNTFRFAPPDGAQKIDFAIYDDDATDTNNQ